MKNLLKKILIICSIIGAISITANTVSMPQVSAADGGFTGNCRYILGFTSWDCNVDISNKDTLKSGIWTIAANIAVDITVAAAYLIIGYVIYGGYLYTFSGGDPSKVATGKKALTQAFIGLAIVLSANVILNSISIALGADFTAKRCITAENTTECYDDGENDPVQMVSSMLQWIIGIAGVVSAIFVVYGGISYITSTGDPGKVKKAKDMILYALIGLAIVGLSEIIVVFVSNIITEANNNSSDANPTSYINQTITSKETYEA